MTPARLRRKPRESQRGPEPVTHTPSRARTGQTGMADLKRLRDPEARLGQPPQPPPWEDTHAYRQALAPMITKYRWILCRRLRRWHDYAGRPCVLVPGAIVVRKRPRAIMMLSYLSSRARYRIN